VNATGPREHANGSDLAKARSPVGLNQWRPVAHPGRMRELVRGMCSDWAVSIRQACGAIGLDRPTFHNQSRRTDQAAVAKRIREICERRVRYGYRRVHVLLDREGWGINLKKSLSYLQGVGDAAQAQDTEAVGKGQAAR